MIRRLVFDAIKEGDWEDEAICEVKTKFGTVEYFKLNKQMAKSKAISVSVLASQNYYALVDLSIPTVSGSQRIWVSTSKLIV